MLFVSSDDGSLSNVIGLPIELFKSVITELLEIKYENPNWKIMFKAFIAYILSAHADISESFQEIDSWIKVLKN